MTTLDNASRKKDSMLEEVKRNGTMSITFTHQDLFLLECLITQLKYSKRSNIEYLMVNIVLLIRKHMI